MKKNVGTIDRAIRIIAALVVVILYATGLIYGWFGIILLIIAGILLLTSLVSFCPLYTLLGVNTCKNEKKE
jgi:hypothetical protein